MAKVWGYATHGEYARRAEIVWIYHFANKDTIHEILGVIDECMTTYPNASLVVDDNLAGLATAKS